MRLTTLFLLAGTTVFLNGCGNPHFPQPGTSEPLNGIVKARAFVRVDSNGRFIPMASNGTIPIDLVNDPSVTFALDTTKFSIPPITNSVLDFGSIGISQLTDNDLRRCGTPRKKCAKAFVRIYTTGTPGPGLWNTDGGYGMPISAAQSGTAPLLVGLEEANAAVVQIITIPITKNVLNLTDFSPVPNYLIKSDFTNAGAGRYSTILVVEYGLLEN